jgi:hypothetical protein
MAWLSILDRITGGFRAAMTTTILSDKARAFLAEQRFAVLATINRDGTA